MVLCDKYLSQQTEVHSEESEAIVQSVFVFALLVRAEYKYMLQYVSEDVALLQENNNYSLSLVTLVPVLGVL